MTGNFPVLRNIILIAVLSLVVGNMNALHIIGGDVTYTCRGIDTVANRVRFLITFTMYRDSRSGGANFDSPTEFGVYRGSGNSWTHVQTIRNIQVRNVQDIPLDSGNPCIIIPSNVGVQRGVYSFEVVLDIIDQSYQISYQRCCRNNSILNLNNPGDTGAAFTTEISPIAQQTCNNSPIFNGFPPVVICANQPINFNHSATDADGDQLVYEFCSPLTAGGTDGSMPGGNARLCTGVTPSPEDCRPPYQAVSFALPSYSFISPMGGNPVVAIDPLTGIIDGAPNILGQFVVGVCVKEYRNGELIGTLRRDFQFNVTTCEIAVTADIEATSKTATEYNVTSCGDFTIDFLNLSTDVRFIQNYYWEFDIDGKPEIRTTRNASITFPGVGQYSAIMILNKDIPGLSSCSDTARINVNVFPSIDADFVYEYDTCVAGPVQFLDRSVSGSGIVNGWSWDFLEGTSISKDPNYLFREPGEKRVQLIAEDINKCKDTINQIVTWYPVPPLLIIEPSTFIGCKPASILFNNLSMPIDESYILDWKFGDGGIGSDISPVHIYENIGTYTVSLEVISPIGCKTSKVFPDLITIVPSPIAGFSYSPEDVSIFNNTLTFNDESQDAVSWLWNFGNLGAAFIQNPQFTFRDTGVYEVQQVVLHRSGCTDTAYATIDVRPVVNVFLPNAFTPNNDGLNDEFRPVGVFDGIRSYKLAVWNRWGERIFETEDFREGWNGQLRNSGSNSPPGVYAWILEYINPRGEIKNEKGSVTLIR
ncbi:MAG: gliding motility-associated C-terminal domain-containing protein [Saprospiraceae bacterium]|nr:gliding motility-associated C-terminal domain-containing protein [Saprospiraceae bacterium]